MKRMLVVLLALALLPCSALAEGEAARVMELLGARDFEAVFDLSSEEMRAQVGTADVLAEVWAQLETNFGAYLSCADIVRVETQDNYDTYTIQCDFEHVTATLRLAFDAEGLLAGLAVARYTLKPAAPDEAGGYVEERIALRAGEADETAGRLTLPEGEGPFPCVIMMPGSGPSDMDATIYGRAIFQELARMLARQGVASVRYDKFPYAHADLVTPEFTVDDEYAYDAADALALLADDARIGDVFLLGHSQGAMVAPRVAERLQSDRVAGAVLLCGSPLPLSEILLRQLRDQGAGEPLLDGFRADFDGMWEMTDEELLANDVAGTPLYYWRDEADYDDAGAILSLNLPVFIAQGDKDFQVLPAEGVEAYEAALAGYEGATYARYPDMNHLLSDMDGEVTGTATDYANPGSVSKDLALDVAAWIYSQAED